MSTAQSGCWVWLGYQDVEGYGSLRWHGRTVRAHRLAYELTYGPVPADVCVCHTCDVPACVNPQHLWVGTNRDNQDDCTRKGRRPIGERHGSRTHPERVPRGEQHCNAKLTQATVRVIRASAESARAVAQRYGISKTHVVRIRRGESWKET